MVRRVDFLQNNWRQERHVECRYTIRRMRRYDLRKFSVQINDKYLNYEEYKNNLSNVAS